MFQGDTFIKRSVVRVVSFRLGLSTLAWSYYIAVGAMHPSLRQQGFVVAPRVPLPDDIPRRVAAETRKSCVGAIFNHSDEDASVSDRKRLQRLLPWKDAAWRGLEASILASVAAVAPHVTTTLVQLPWNLLQSRAGCQQQASHTDWVPTEAVAEAVAAGTPPLAVLVALMDGTTLEVWPRATGLTTRLDDAQLPTTPIPQQTVRLRPGDVLVFRPDCVHAGSAYAEPNVRLHAYFDNPLVARARNTTWTIKRFDPALFACLRHSAPRPVVPTASLAAASTGAKSPVHNKRVPRVRQTIKRRGATQHRKSPPLRVWVAPTKARTSALTPAAAPRPAKRATPVPRLVGGSSQRDDSQRTHKKPRKMRRCMRCG